MIDLQVLPWNRAIYHTNLGGWPEKAGNPSPHTSPRTNFGGQISTSNAKAKQIKRPPDGKEFHKLEIERCQLGSLKNGSAGELTLTRAVQLEDVTDMQGKAEDRQKGHDCNAKSHSGGRHNRFRSSDFRGCRGVGDDRSREMQMDVVAGIAQVSTDR